MLEIHNFGIVGRGSGLRGGGGEGRQEKKLDNIFFSCWPLIAQQKIFLCYNN